ncbi:MAG: tyrosine-type recombinase/integrase [Burkholderiaceae bacterium]|nr:tyrosine-type recombinase/integrase [Burkholderiaceae bacterium]
MTQHSDVLLAIPSYTRNDYLALRAYSRGLPPERVVDLYYSFGSPPWSDELVAFLDRMREQLVQQAVDQVPALVPQLRQARRSGDLPPALLDAVLQAAANMSRAPDAADPIGRWLRPRTAQALLTEGIAHLGDLVSMINRRGSNWWRAVPRIGVQRAAVIETWLRQHPETLGPLRPAVMTAGPHHTMELLDPAASQAMVPLGRFYLPTRLDGHDGVNRSAAFCFISARDDLAAVQCYLARFDGQTHTQRAYRKELERFVLWAIHVAGKPMSSLLVDDCEAYKRFLAAPSPAFCGRAAQHGSPLWRPFAETPMAPASQKYALMVLRAAFDYWVKVRYLAGNPWTVVKDPLVRQELDAIQVGRALSPETWNAVVTTLARRAEATENSQDRVALAAILLMGDSGLRREEAAKTLRMALQPSPHARGVWMLKVVGKRNKVRIVPVSLRTIAALQAHWLDHGQDFMQPDQERPLFAPVTVPGTASAQARHNVGTGLRGYTPNAMYALVKAALTRVRRDWTGVNNMQGAAEDITVEDIEQLHRTSPHAFRHTFGSVAVEKDVPLNIVQEIMGHEDSATTSLYVKARAKRIAEEAAKYYAEQVSGAPDATGKEKAPGWTP